MKQQLTVRGDSPQPLALQRVFTENNQFAMFRGARAMSLRIFVITHALV